MKHKVTMTVTVDANQYRKRGTEANAVEVVYQCLRGQADWPPNAHIRISAGKSVRVLKTKGTRWV